MTYKNPFKNRESSLGSYLVKSPKLLALILVTLLMISVVSVLAYLGAFSRADTPGAITLAPKNITSGSAVLRGSGSLPNEVEGGGFEWGTDTNYGNTVNADDLVIRKYNPSTEEYQTIENSFVDQSTVGGELVLIVQYTVVDNESLDTNDTAGVITDPAGPAISTAVAPQEEHTEEIPAAVTTSASGGDLAETGATTNALNMLAVMMFLGASTGASLAYAKKAGE